MPGGDKRVGNLEENRRPTAQERRNRCVANPPDDAFGREVAIAARKPLRVRPLMRICGPGPGASHSDKGARDTHPRALVRAGPESSRAGACSDGIGRP
jgi:hypothetical protein